MLGERLFIIMLILIPSVIVMAIQLAAIYYYGKPGMILSGLALSVAVFVVYNLFLSFAKGMGDSKGTGSPHTFSLFSIEFLICLSAMAVLTVGLYFFAEFLKTGVLNKLVFFSWLGLVVGTPTVYYGFLSIRESLETENLTANYVKASIDISHFRELPIYIDKIEFENTINGLKSEVPFRNSYYSNENIDSMELEERIVNANSKIEIDNELIPLGSNKFYMSWYSFVEDKYYNDSFPFPFDEFKVRDFQIDYYKRISIDLKIKAGGKVDMIASKNNKLFPYFDVASRELNEEERAHFVELYAGNSKDYQLAFDSAVQEIRSSKRLLKRMTMNESVFNWKLLIDRPDSEFSIRMVDFKGWEYETSYEWQNTYGKKSLPSELSIYFKKPEEPYFQIYFRFEMEKLYDAVDSLTTGDYERPIEMLMVVKGNNKEDLQIFLVNDQQKVELKDWTTNIVNY